MKFFKWVSIVIGLVLAVVLFGVVGIQLYLNTEQAKDRIQARVNHAIPGTLTWRTNRFSIPGGKMELKHVLLTGPEHDKLIELKRFSIHLSWIGLLRGELNIHDLFLENPQISLVKDRSGNFNLIQALYTPEDKPSDSGKNGGLPFNILIRQLSVINGFFQYNTAEETAENQIDQAEFQNINLTITDGNLFKQTGRLVCRIAGGKIQSKAVRTNIDQLSFKANVQKERIDDLLFDVNTDGVHANIAGTVEYPFTDKPILDLRLKSRASLSNIKDFVSLGPDFSGEIEVDSNLKGAIRNPDIDLKLRYKGGKLAGHRIDRIHLNCSLKNKNLNISDSNAYTPLGRLDIKGNVDFGTALSDDQLTSRFNPDALSYKFFIRHNAPRLEYTAPGISGLKGAVHADIKIEGKGVYPKTLWAETTLELNADKLSAEKMPSPVDAHVKAQAGMANGRITIRNLTAAANGARLEMNGSYDIFSRQALAHFGLTAPDLFDITSKLGITGLQGKVNITGEMSGTMSDPSVEARLTGENLRYEQVRFGKADANFRFSKGRLSLNQGKIMSGDSSVDISGEVQIFDSVNTRLLRHPTFNVAFSGDGLSLKDFVEGMEGIFVLNGRFEGDIAHPKGKLDLYGKNVDLGMQKIHDVQLASRLDGRRVDVDPLTLAIVPGEKIILNGWVSMDKHYELDMVSRDISIKNIQKFSSLNMERGKISLDLAGKGEFSNPQFKGKVVFDDLMFNHKKLEKISFNIGVENQTAYIDGGLNFDLKATYGLQTRSFSTSARFDHTDVTPYLQLFGKKELSGAVTGSIDAKGNLRTPVQIDGAINIARLELFWNNMALITGRDLGVFVNQDEITIPEMRLSLFEQGHFTIRGAGKLRGQIDMKAEGIVPFEVLPVFTDSVSDGGGEARFSLHISGPSSGPSFDFDVALKNAELTIPSLFQKFHDINGHIRATPSVVVLDNIKGMLGEGKFDLSGAVDLDRYRPTNIDLRLDVDEVLVTIPDVLETRFSSTLDIRGAPKKSKINGNIEILEGTYVKNVQLNIMENIGRPSRETDLTAPKTPWPIFDHMAVDIAIRYRDPYIVDNNVSLLTVKPDLHLKGTVNRPLISGRAEVETGVVYFRQKEFTVKKGIFDFINPYKIEPTIDIISQVHIRKWVIVLTVSGTPDELRFDMTSNPAEKDEDILSLLIAGKTTQELIDSEGGPSRSPTQILADILAETYQKDIQAATGLDVVRLKYNEAKNTGGSDEVTVTIGKKLSSRVNVRYGIQTQQSKVVQKTITEYQLLEKLLVNTFQDTEGNFGSELQFRLEFR